MNLFNIELEEDVKKTCEERAKEHKYFKRHLALILDAYLNRKISFLTYINKMYEIHRQFKRKGFSKQDLIKGREKFFKQKMILHKIS